jgi:NAD(P)-dependent dehydrogenase (short-subunit alcohol dehydrogenase family)
MSSAKSVVITGCSRGLGRAMVGEFARQGWRVAGCARSADAVRDLAAEFPEPHIFHVCDVADEAKVADFCGAVLERCGAPDLVLNNAALINRSAPLWEISAEEFSHVIDVNIKGPASVMRHLLPAMLERGSGVIVNFSSGWGRSTSPEVAPYCATKFAIEGLSMAAAQETGGAVAIVPLNPGVIDTEMLRSCFGAGAAGYPGPEEWARAAVPYLIQLGPQDNGRPATAPGG